MTTSKSILSTNAPATTTRRSTPLGAALVLAGIAIASASVALELSTLDLQRLVDPRQPSVATDLQREALHRHYDDGSTPRIDVALRSLSGLHINE